MLGAPHKTQSSALHVRTPLKRPCNRPDPGGRDAARRRSLHAGNTLLAPRRRCQQRPNLGPELSFFFRVRPQNTHTNYRYPYHRPTPTMNTGERDRGCVITVALSESTFDPVVSLPSLVRDFGPEGAGYLVDLKGDTCRIDIDANSSR
jgi:hypothetical protein